MKKPADEFVFFVHHFWGKIAHFLYFVTIHSRNSHQGTALGHHWDEPKEENKDTIAKNTRIVWWALDDEDSDRRDQENYQREENDSGDDWSVDVKACALVEDREA